MNGKRLVVLQLNSKLLACKNKCIKVSSSAGEKSLVSDVSIFVRFERCPWIIGHYFLLATFFLTRSKFKTPQEKL